MNNNHDDENGTGGFNWGSLLSLLVVFAVILFLREMGCSPGQQLRG
jgi:hypothetical protein